MKWFKRFLFLVLVIIAVFSGFAFFTGNTYLFNVVGQTILRGRMGPDIDDFKKKPSRVVSIGTPQPWTKNIIAKPLSSEDQTYLNKYNTVEYVVIKDGQLVFERYTPPFDDTSRGNSWSMAKSIVSLLVGIAVKEGTIHSLDATIGYYLPDYENTNVTIRHLLMMSSGFDHKESYINPLAYPARALYGSNIKQVHKKYGPKDVPGKNFVYQSGDTELLAFILEKATGKKLADYASEKLWKKLGAESPALWSLDANNGMEIAFCCFNSNAKDFARIGQLMLNNGVWNGDTIVDPGYVSAATTRAPLTFLKGDKSKPYGYQWWIINQPNYRGFYARGIKGQYIVVLPEENMVVVRLGREEPKQPKEPYFIDMLRYVDIARNIVR